MGILDRRGQEAFRHSSKGHGQKIWRILSGGLTFAELGLGSGFGLFLPASERLDCVGVEVPVNLICMNRAEPNAIREGLSLIAGHAGIVAGTTGRGSAYVGGLTDIGHPFFILWS
ncbi:hypothetical protein WR25_15570 [Diploscapter pachys]|uniref:Uncharacterized protein n=1 Tax=Diploscapter pachys TaxID=2018661 RepID=A0A2A2JW53_9BILA|nr:hypothetical protein WR25_15570 [Diploscapter pachys]